MINTQPIPVDIHVVYACDRGFLQYLAVSIKSLIDAFETGSHRSTHCLNVHVVIVGFADDDRALLKRIARSETAQVKLALIDYQLTNRYPDALHPHIELVTLKYRFPELLTNIDKVIWIDADTLVVSDGARQGSCRLMCIPIEAMPPRFSGRAPSSRNVRG